ncbi:MAG: thiol-disulfide isomerase/thioredoxin [Arenicella sp.]|jgi:thiol-disulfide isomerase/thioredoxin
MTNQNKVLLLFIAIVAFAVGIAVNTSRTEPVSEASVLLTAQLETSTPGTGASGTDTVENQLTEVTLVNFWATWCSPCREEMPLFETMYRLHQKDGFTVVGVAIDNPSRSQPFLDSMDISYPILYAENTGMQLLEKTGNSQGLLPYSLLLNKDGKVLDQVLGKIDEAQIQAWLSEYL